MYYKKIDNEFTIASLMKMKQDFFPVTEVNSLKYGYYLYVEPGMSEYQVKTDVIIQVENRVTSVVRDMTEDEIIAKDLQNKIKTLGWVFPQMNIRVTVPKSFLRNGGSSFVTKMQVNDYDKYYISDSDVKTTLGVQYLNDLEQADKNALDTAKSTYPEILIEYLQEIEIILE